MSIINSFKRDIDLVTSSSFASNFSFQMRVCQDRLNSIGGHTLFEGIENGGKRRITEVKTKIKQKIQELTNQINSAFETEKIDLKTRIKELKKVVTELEKLERTVTKYNFEIDASPQLNYDHNTDTIMIKYDGTLGSLVNELKHAFQFETGQLDFIQAVNSDGRATNIPGVLYDLNDELETYKRQYAYDGFLKMRVAWTEKELNDFSNNNITDILRGTLSIMGESGNQLGILEVKSMKFVTVDIIVKIKDTASNSSTLYSSLSTSSLDKNSSLRQIQRNNTNRADLGNLSWMGLSSFKKKTPYVEFVKAFIKEKPFIHVK